MARLRCHSAKPETSGISQPWLYSGIAQCSATDANASPNRTARRAATVATATIQRRAPRSFITATLARRPASAPLERTGFPFIAVATAAGRSQRRRASAPESENGNPGRQADNVRAGACAAHAGAAPVAQLAAVDSPA